MFHKKSKFQFCFDKKAKLTANILEEFLQREYLLLDKMKNKSVSLGMTSLPQVPFVAFRVPQYKNTHYNCLCFK